MDLHKLQVSITADIKEFKKKMQDVKKEAENVSRQAKIDAGLLKPTKEYEQLNGEIKKCQKSLDGLLTKQKTMPENKTRQMTTAYSSLQQQIDKTANDLAKLEAELADMASKGYKENDPVFAGMNQEAIKLAGTLEDLLVKKEQMEDSGKAYSETKAYSALKDQINKTKEALDGLNKSKAEMEDSGKAFEEVGKKATNTTKNLHKSSRLSDKLGKSFKRLGKNVLRMGLMFALGGRALYGIVNSIRFGFNNLVQVSEGANKTVSKIKSSMTQVKNSFASAFLPVLQAIEPLLTRVLGLLSNMLDKVAQFFTALTGGTSYKKAVNYYEDYADSVSNANDKLLAFDKINKLSNNTDPNNYFVDSKVDSKIASVADKVKNAIEKIKSSIDIDKWKKRFNELKETINKLKDSFVEFWKSESVTKLRNMFKSLVEYISDSAWDTFIDILGFIADAIDVVRTSLDLMFSVLTKGFKDSKEELEAFKASWGDFLNNIWNRITSGGNEREKITEEAKNNMLARYGLVSSSTVSNSVPSAVTTATSMSSANKLNTALSNVGQQIAQNKRNQNSTNNVNVSVSLEADTDQLFKVLKTKTIQDQSRTGIYAFGG